MAELPERMGQVTIYLTTAQDMVRKMITGKLDATRQKTFDELADALRLAHSEAVAVASDERQKKFRALIDDPVLLDSYHKWERHFSREHRSVVDFSVATLDSLEDIHAAKWPDCEFTP